jgi:hypothetical protein
MTPNSRDNVNTEATVTCTAYDRNGDVVDRDTYHGRYEPATRFLDFMLNCEAMFGKHGDKIIRFSCEVAYVVLISMLFLSSPRAEATHGSYTGTVQRFSSGDIHWVDAKSGVVRTIHARPSAETFTKTQEPVRYVITWPPTVWQGHKLVETEAEAMARRSFEHIQQVVHTPNQEPKPSTPWWHPALFVFGAIALVAALTFQRWRVLAKI